MSTFQSRNPWPIFCTACALRVQCVRTACAVRAHCVHTAHAKAEILTQEYLSPV